MKVFNFSKHVFQFLYLGWTGNNGGRSSGSSGGHFGGQQSQNSNLQKLRTAGCKCHNKVDTQFIE